MDALTLADHPVEQVLSVSGRSGLSGFSIARSVGRCRPSAGTLSATRFERVVSGSPHSRQPASAGFRRGPARLTGTRDRGRRSVGSTCLKAVDKPAEAGSSGTPCPLSTRWKRVANEVPAEGRQVCGRHSECMVARWLHVVWPHHRRATDSQQRMNPHRPTFTEFYQPTPGPPNTGYLD